jgi:hypothetical protein
MWIILFFIMTAVFFGIAAYIGITGIQDVRDLLDI